MELLREKIAEIVWERHFRSSTDHAFPSWEDAHDKLLVLKLMPPPGSGEHRIPVDVDQVAGALRYCYDTTDLILTRMVKSFDA